MMHLSHNRKMKSTSKPISLTMQSKVTLTTHSGRAQQAGTRQINTQNQSMKSSSNSRGETHVSARLETSQPKSRLEWNRKPASHVHSAPSSERLGASRRFEQQKANHIQQQQILPEITGPAQMNFQHLFRSLQVSQNLSAQVRRPCMIISIETVPT